THVQSVHSLLIDVPLTMSFFDRQAVKFHKQLEAIRGGDPRVLLLPALIQNSWEILQLQTSMSNCGTKSLSTYISH
ncbi:unnamed protein product, partial [Brassica napus]